MERSLDLIEMIKFYRINGISYIISFYSKMNNPVSLSQSQNKLSESTIDIAERRIHRDVCEVKYIKGN